MAKPLDTHTDKELEGALAEGGLTERKAAVAEEILRRRQDTKSGTLREKHGWMCVACSLRFRIIQPEAPLAKAGRQLVIAISDPEYAQLVRYWHKADIDFDAEHVCFRG